MKQHHPILREIEAYLAVTKMGETYFGKRAANNSELVARLRAGGSVHFKTEDSIREFIKDNPPSENQSKVSCLTQDMGSVDPEFQGGAA